MTDTNYSLTVVGASVSANISPKPITIINNTVSPTYDGVTTYAGLISPTAFTLSTLLVGSDNISGVTQAFTVSSSPVSGVVQAGTFVATPSNPILSTGTASNYSFSYTASTNTVAKANLAITGTPSTSGNTYNGNAYTGTYTTTFLGTDASNVTITGAATRINAGTYTSNLEVTGDPLSNYNKPVITNANLVIDPKPITISGITANGKIYDGTKSVTLNKPEVIDLGFFTRDNILITTTGAFNDENAGTRTVALTQSYSGTISNYTITNQSVEPTAVISKRPITVTAENKTKVYGDSTPTLTYTVASDAGPGSSTSRGLAPTDSLVTVFAGGPGTSDTILTGVGNVEITIGTLSANSNYTIAEFNKGSLSITARPITVTADNKTKVYGDSNPALTYTITSGNLVNSNTLSGSLTINADEKTSVTLSPVDITQGNLAASSNYNLTFAKGALSITQRPITVTAENKTKVYGDNNPTLTYSVASDAGSVSLTSRGLVNGDALSGSITAEATPSTGVGNVDIVKGELTGNPNYTIAKFNNGKLTITARPITISANDISTTYGTSLALGTSAYSITSGSLATASSDAISSVTLQYNGSATVPSTINAGTYDSGIIASSATGSGGFNSTNYNITYAAGKLTVDRKSLLITANDQSTTYGTALTLLTTTITPVGLINSDAVTSATLLSNSLAIVSATTNAGTYSIVPSAALGTGLSNYNISYSNGTLTVNQANLTVTGTQVYNGTTTFAPSNLVIRGVNGETFTATGTATLSSKNVQSNQHLQTISLTLAGVSGASTSNYNTLTTGQTSVSVTPATVSLSANKTYDGNTDLTGSIIILTGITGETLNYINATANSKNVLDASYINAITLRDGTGLASNYQLPSLTAASIDNAVAISTKAVSISGITASDKVYDGTTLAIINTSGSVVGLVVGDKISVTTTGVFSDANVKDDKTVALTTTISGTDYSNYNYTIQGTATASITPALLQVIAGNSAKFTSQLVDPVGYNDAIYVGLVGGDTPAILSSNPSLKLSLSRSDPDNNNAGTYTLTPSGFGTKNGNYQISYQNGIFTIVPKNTLLVSVKNQSIDYSATPSYVVTAKYLDNDNNKVSLGVTITRSTITRITVVSIDDGFGRTANFRITPALASLSGSENFKVGGYNLSAADQNISALFSSMVITGTLQVNAKSISPTSLVANVSKVYDGNTSITQTNSTITINPGDIQPGDTISVTGIGYYTDNTNVGTVKPLSLNVFLAGKDSSNYALSSNSFTTPVGTISQLASVIYTGPVGGNWSDPLNWNGGAIPTLSNVAQVVIPAATSVVYDYARLTSLVPTSTIVDNGTLTISSPTNLTFNNIISGTGSLSLSGAGTITLIGNNSYTGGTNIGNFTLVIGHVNAIGSGAITSSNGTLQISPDILEININLIVNGPVKLASDIKTTGAQTYNGGVILDAGYAVSDVVTPMTISTVNGDITFGGTLAAGNNALSTKQSLTLNAGGATSIITFNDTVGSMLTTNGSTYADYLKNPGTASIYNLNVTGAKIIINANITTFATQEYHGAVTIGDNKTNGKVRTILAEYTDSPKITFFGTVDDSTANTHDLIVKAVSLSGKGSEVTFEGAIGSIVPLKTLTVSLGLQNSDTSSKYSDIKPNEYLDGVIIKGDITTYGDQNYAQKTELEIKTTLKCLNAGCSVNFFKNSSPGGKDREKYEPKGYEPVPPTIPNVINAAYETTDLQRFSSRIATQMGDRSDDKVSTGGSISVVFCGAGDDLMDRLRAKCEDI